MASLRGAANDLPEAIDQTGNALPTFYDRSSNCIRFAETESQMTAKRNATAAAMPAKTAR
jgi:hypothetical protein